MQISWSSVSKSNTKEAKYAFKSCAAAVSGRGLKMVFL